MLRLKPGGRLVAIVGRGMALERPTFRKWWTEIGQRFRVRANLGIDGSAYARFGTTFDNQIIVIDRDGTALPSLHEKCSQRPSAMLGRGTTQPQHIIRDRWHLVRPFGPLIRPQRITV